MNIRVEIDLPDGRSAEFSESPTMTSYAHYRKDAREILDRQYEAAKRWLDDQEPKPAATVQPTA